MSGYVHVDAGEWPNGDTRFLAILKLEPGQLAAHTGVRFVEDRDDLDRVLVAVIESRATGHRYGLLRYERSPSAGTDVYSSKDLDPGIGLPDVLDSLGLTSDDVDCFWNGTELIRPLSP